ncbi:snRNA-activating protein complex subunit 3 [Drosophila grimshawi]|uniref:snRNA-activating protein complex subunit 3 n=1 Tax=Drosophila grimshawi TaxID=7222 RepID=B4J8B8_DROGR|nr:snRNA-activating protein complex subunit 3 [Drosophila grimshawi]EDW02277.1 GH19985 [Drosophila grimshawi]
MENVLESPQPPISLRQFLDEYKNQLNSSNENTDNIPFYFAENSPVSPDVEASCSLQLLATSDDNLINVFEPGNEMRRHTRPKPQADDNVPKTYTAIKEHKDYKPGNPFARTQYSYRLISESLTSGDLKPMWSLQQFDLAITVRFYRPPRASHRNYKLERPMFAEEFVCLGSNYLTELRDKISCICNGKRFVDISEDPEAPLPVLDTNPGYFFINDTFYNDTRNPNNCDYSKTVLQWARTASGFQDEGLKVAAMESTRFLDLTVRLGAPLQYLHHGNCEHLFVFSQVEVVWPHILCSSSYPYLRAFNPFNGRACFICGIRSYHFIVEQSRRQLHDPAYLCRSCHYSYNYVDGKKVGQFRAYRIYDNSERSDDEVAKQLQEILDISDNGNNDSH